MKLRRRFRIPPVVGCMFGCATLLVLISVTPALFVTRCGGSRYESCQKNLARIKKAKDRYLLDNVVAFGSEVEIDDLVSSSSRYLKSFPIEPSGGSYSINPVGTNPTCNTGYPGHSLSEIGKKLSELEH